jgi:carbonic anhydrase
MMTYFLDLKYFFRSGWQWLMGWLTGLLVLLAVGLFAPSLAWAAESPPEWEYGGAANPTHWGELSDDFALCETGHSQSPINLVGDHQGEVESLIFHYQPTPLKVVNNGRTILVPYEPGSSLQMGDERYELLQFHFHTPSEHTINGDAAAMELHLVHRNAAGQLAVLGVMLQPGESQAVIEQLWQHLPAGKGTSEDHDIWINAADLLPKNHAYFSYSGSLTTPPCSEGVSWNVLKNPTPVSLAQIASFEQFYQVNARPLQAIEHREVEFHPAK